MNEEEIKLNSFQIIAHSGDALDCFQKAINCAKENDYIGAEENLKNGKKYMVEAHKVQTKLLTSETCGETIDISVILLHAQDHLMTTLQYERTANEFIEMYKKMNELESIIRRIEYGKNH